MDNFDALDLTTNLQPESRLDFKRATIHEVREFVVPEGACTGIGTLRVNQGPTFIENDKILEERVKFLRGYLDGLINDDMAISIIANLSEGQQLSKDKLKEIFGLGKGYEFIVTRLYYVVNYDIDPDLVPTVVGYHFKNSGLSEVVKDSLENDPSLVVNLVDLLVDADFKKEFYLGSYPGANPYSDKLEQKIDYIKGRWFANIKKNNTDPQKLEELEKMIDDFFNLKRKLWPQESETLFNTEMYLRSATASKYFETKRINSIGELSDWAPSSINISELLAEHAVALEKGKYLVNLLRDVDVLYTEYFPEIYDRPDIRKLSLEDPMRPWSSKPEENCELTNGYWSRDRNEIGIKSGTVIKAKLSEEIAREDSINFSGSRMNRRIIDMITMIHEETHAIYETTVRKGTVRPKDYDKTADHAINEGTSVLMELLMGDMLVQDSRKLGFSADKIKQLQQMKIDRLYRLKKNRNGYTQGTFNILHKVYESGAGKIGNRNMRNGLLAVKRFLTAIDPSKTLKIQRDSKEYMDALKSGDPQQLLHLFA